MSCRSPFSAAALSQSRRSCTRPHPHPHLRIALQVGEDGYRGEQASAMTRLVLSLPRASFVARLVGWQPCRQHGVEARVSAAPRSTEASTHRESQRRSVCIYILLTAERHTVTVPGRRWSTWRETHWRHESATTAAGVLFAYFFLLLSYEARRLRRRLLNGHGKDGTMSYDLRRPFTPYARPCWNRMFCKFILC